LRVISAKGFIKKKKWVLCAWSRSKNMINEKKETEETKKKTREKNTGGILWV
jgi:hypothetical protein